MDFSKLRSVIAKSIEFFVTTAVISDFTGKIILLLLWTYIFFSLLKKKKEWTLIGGSLLCRVIPPAKRHRLVFLASVKDSL
jgi:hypothetical protein